MRRHVAIFVMVVYGILSVGIHLHMHYCCGQLSDISIFDHNACDHHDENDGGCCKKSTDCCRFEDITLKLDESHNATYFKILISAPADVVPVASFEPATIATQIDLLYKPIRRIPRNIINYVEDITKSYKIPFIYVGSYRRGSSSSSDMDVLIKRNNPLPSDFIETLNKKIGTYVYFYEPYALGDSKISVILNVKKYKVNVKMDIFITNKLEYPFALLYSTGSKEFNIMMRSRCKKMGLLLNQKGLYKSDGTLINCVSEKDIFEAIGMVYISPLKR